MYAFVDNPKQKISCAVGVGVHSVGLVVFCSFHLLHGIKIGLIGPNIPNFTVSLVKALPECDFALRYDGEAQHGFMDGIRDGP